MSKRFLAVVFLSLFAATTRSASAQCATSVSATAPNADGIISYTVTVADGSCSYQAKAVGTQIDGHPGPGASCDDRGATPCPSSWTFTWDTNCQATGTHEIYVDGVCTLQGTTGCFSYYQNTTTTYEVNNQPGVSLSVSDPDRDGHSHAEATGSYPHHQGWVEMSWAGGGLGHFERASTTTASTLTVAHDFTFDCSWADGPLTFDAASWVCYGGTGSEAHAPSKTIEITTDPELSIAAGPHGPTEVAVTYDYVRAGNGNLTYTVDGGAEQPVPDPECHHRRGTCYVTFPCDASGQAHDVQFHLTACAAHRDSNTLTIREECADSGACRSCSTSGGASSLFGDLGSGSIGVGNPARPMCVGDPINVGSGNVRVEVPLFSLSEPGAALRFALSHDSTARAAESTFTRPLGPGWSHSYNLTMRPVDPMTSNRLVSMAPDGEPDYYDRTGATTWSASRPASSMDTVSLVSGQYLLRTLRGDTTTFDAATGRWLSTSDRYGNTISGSYDGSGKLTTITDPLGRTITLAYSGTLLASVTLWDASTQWQFAYTSGELSGIADPLHATPNWRTFEYVTAHRAPAVARLLTAMRDSDGKALETHTYDDRDRGLTSMREGSRNAYTVEYDQPAFGQVRVTETTTDPDPPHAAVGRVTVYTPRFIGGTFVPLSIDGVCASCGATTDSQVFTYDSVGRVLSRTDGEGHVTTYAYDANGQIVTRTEAAGTPRQRVTTVQHAYALDPTLPTQTSLPSVVDGGAQKTLNLVWNTGETVLTSSITGKIPGPTPTTETYTSTRTYDAKHRLLGTHGPRTDVATVTSSTYYGDSDATLDRRGRMETSTDAAGLVTTYDDYDLFGTPRSIVDPNGVLRTRVTDAVGRVTSETIHAVATDPAETTDYTRTMSYDGRDRLVAVTNGRGLVTNYAYEDGTNRLTDTIRLDAAGAQRERRHLTLDESGRVLREEDQSCDTPAAVCASWTTRHTVAHRYDLHGRLAENDQPLPAGAKSLYAYDDDGRLVSMKDENHATANTTYAYDELDRLTTVTQKLAGAPGGVISTSYGYDAQDNLVSVTDPNGNETAYVYDDFGRMREQTSPVTGTTEYSYDPAGNLTSTTDARGAVTTRTYDAANRVLSATSVCDDADTEIVTWTYDDATAGRYGKGRVASMSDPSGSTDYFYERRGLLRLEQRAIGLNSYETSYAYDANGNRTAIGSSQYAFDWADRPSSLTTQICATMCAQRPVVASVSYAPFGPETEIAYSNDTVQTKSYDARYRLTENRLTAPDGTTLLADWTYGMDAVGNITTIDDALNSNYDRSFAYDDLNRLTTANTAAGLWGTGSYTYDRMGNMLTSSVGTRSQAFAYDGTTPKISTLTEGEDALSVQYDAAGNELTGTSFGLSPGGREYSCRSLLGQTSTPVRPHCTRDFCYPATTALTSYTYDGRGVRVHTDGPDFSLGSDYIYTPELNLRSRIRTDGEWAETFLWLNGHPVAHLITTNAPYPNADLSGRYMVTDHLGTPMLETDLDGVIQWQAEYEPYGNVYVMRTGMPTDQILRLPGQELAASSGDGAEENYNIFRWYRAGWGRYTQPDPIELLAGANLFSYTLGNPIRYSDRFGLLRGPMPTPTVPYPQTLPPPACAPEPSTWSPGMLSGVGTTLWAFFFDPPALNQAGAELPDPRPGRCRGCPEGAEDNRDDRCYDQWIREDHQCEQWWRGGSSVVQDYRRACKQSAFTRYSECLRHGTPRSPLSPQPGQ